MIFLVADLVSVLFLNHNMADKELKLEVEVKRLLFYCCSLIILVLVSIQGLLKRVCISHLSIL